MYLIHQSAKYEKSGQSILFFKGWHLVWSINTCFFPLLSVMAFILTRLLHLFVCRYYILFRASKEVLCFGAYTFQTPLYLSTWHCRTLIPWGNDPFYKLHYKSNSNHSYWIMFIVLLPPQNITKLYFTYFILQNGLWVMVFTFFYVIPIFCSRDCVRR